MPRLAMCVISPTCGGKGNFVRLMQKRRPEIRAFTYSTPIRQFLQEVNKVIGPSDTVCQKKTAIEKLVTELYGRDVLERGCVVAPDPMGRFYEQFRRLHFPLAENRENVQDISTFIRQSFGEDTFARKIAQLVGSVEGPIAIAEGARRPDDIVHLRRLPGVPLVVVYIDAPRHRRHAWYVKRNQNIGDDQMTAEEFERLDNKESEQKIPGMRADADVVIMNHSTYPWFARRTHALLGDLRARFGV